MKAKVLIPTRGVIALDLIDSCKKMGLETYLMYSPEDGASLAVKLADKSYKFYSSQLRYSYLDREAIIEKAQELKVDFLHPGYGFLAENADFFNACRSRSITIVGPERDVLEIVSDKLKLRKAARSLNIPVLAHSRLVLNHREAEEQLQEMDFPLLMKPLNGSGGRGIRLAGDAAEARRQIKQMFKRSESLETGIFFEPYLGQAHEIEIPFIRDNAGNVLFFPDIESSIQRRFQKIVQESPSVNLNAKTREILYRRSFDLLQKISYTGYGCVEFLLSDRKAFLSEINPSIQTNTLLAQLHLGAPITPLQFAVTSGESLNISDPITIIEPRQHLFLSSLMAENPAAGYQPSAGRIKSIYLYNSPDTVFKTHLFAGARVSPIYDPFIGKMASHAPSREEALTCHSTFLDHLTIRGIHTNLSFMRHLCRHPEMQAGNTPIHFLDGSGNIANREKSAEERLIAAAALSVAFHLENQKRNYKNELQKQKPRSFIDRLLRRFRG